MTRQGTLSVEICAVNATSPRDYPVSARCICAMTHAMPIEHLIC